MLNTMRNIMVVACLAIPALTLAPTADAAEVETATTMERVGGQDKFGIGLDLGYPFNGLTFSYFATERNLLQLEVGYHATPGSFDLTKGADTGLAFRGMYQGYPAVLARGEGFTLPFFIGVGASYAFNVQESVGWFSDNDTMVDSDILSVFMPVGLQCRFRNAPVSIYAQLEPAVEFVRAPGTLLREADVDFSPRLGVGGALHF